MLNNDFLESGETLTNEDNLPMIFTPSASDD